MPRSFWHLAELPTPLKKRRLSPLDACMSESSTPYGSPCATPTRTEQSETTLTPALMATPPRPRTEEPSTEPLPSTPTPTLNAPQEVKLCLCISLWTLHVCLHEEEKVAKCVCGYTEWIFRGELTRGQPKTLCAGGEIILLIYLILKWL